MLTTADIQQERERKKVWHVFAGKGAWKHYSKVYTTLKSGRKDGGEVVSYKILHSENITTKPWLQTSPWKNYILI